MPAAPGKCCRSTPRCRSCPLRRKELPTEIAALMTPPALPPHLVGVPRCLHKYEPLLRRTFDEREAQPVGSAPPS
jgi:hypothetical protein